MWQRVPPSFIENVTGKFRPRVVAFLHDLAMVPVAWMGAYWLRSNLDSIPTYVISQMLTLLPVVWVIQGCMFWFFGLYRGIWRFASIPDMVRILKSVMVGLAISAAVIFLLTRLEYVPRSVFVLDGILLILLLGGPRLLYRWLKDRHLYLGSGKRTLIVGAGSAGELLARDLLRSFMSYCHPVAFVDDDPDKAGKEIHGYPVAGDCSAIPEIVKQFGIEMILIAMPSASVGEIRRVVEICEHTGLPFRTLPRMQDIVSGRVGLKDLRDVRIEDLLGRDPVNLDWQAITDGIHRKIVLVTGGGGSIGSELCRQIARLQPTRLIVLDRSELNLFTIEREIRKSFPGLSLDVVLADIRDSTCIEETLKRYTPAIVFHAAAYKHVPLLENQARAAVLNNVFGTAVIARLAGHFGCESFVLISTDKAVNPANTMGETKRIAEMVCQHEQNGNARTKYITVRFGNVMGSSGSVIPLFQEQIARGGPVTVTHPDVTRYFMTMPEASQLILQASVIGRGGEIFVLDMGEPVRIAYLAEQMIRLSGKVPGEDIEIVFTGLRPGEKLEEELFHVSERMVATDHSKILLAASRHVDGKFLEKMLGTLEDACANGDEEHIRQALAKLIPERRQSDAVAGSTGVTTGYPAKLSS